ncbi:RimK/LysX family protein [Candidatus Saccharibacteria bacterium TM7i]|nr:RimK/LysX family protein [Candidatus Saccharibacteria bacterium TM7i]
MQEETVIIGCLEQVAFPALLIDEVMAKIDTGAYSGALHCNKIDVIDRDGVRTLRYQPIHESSEFIETQDFVSTHVTSSNGQRHKRYIIETPILIRGKQYTMRIGLTDRSDMKIDVLIGRRFLRKNNMIVDVRIGAEFDEDGGGKE